VAYDVPQAPGMPDTGATTGRGKPRVTMAWSPVLAVDDNIKGRHGDVIVRAID
jgi:hypothetical protein